MLDKSIIAPVVQILLVDGAVSAAKSFASSRIEQIASAKSR
jgi:hypothetical protein